MATDTRTYAERMDAVCAELRALLAPQTEQESRIVEWLGNWDLPTLEPMRDMVARAKADAWDEGFKQGGPMHDVNYDNPDAHKRNPYRSSP